MTIHNFNERLSWSQGRKKGTWEDVIKSLIHGCVEVQQSDDEDDKNGVDYWASLRSGAFIAIDLKARGTGASRFWRFGEPEFALETWAVIPENGLIGKTGWALSEAKNVDYILFAFEDTDLCYLVPFQLLRMAFVENYKIWKSQYGETFQHSQGAFQRWRSKAVFVPASVVCNAVSSQMIKKIA